RHADQAGEGQGPEPRRGDRGCPAISRRTAVARRVRPREARAFGFCPSHRFASLRFSARGKRAFGARFLAFVWWSCRARAGRSRPWIRDRRALLELAAALDPARPQLLSMKGFSRSIGAGKMIVDEFVAPTSSSVCR